MLGYYMVVMKDLCATWSEALHEGALSKIDQFYGQVVTSTEVLDCWQKRGSLDTPQDVGPGLRAI